MVNAPATHSIAGRMNAGERNGYRIEFTIEGDLRFLSHHETMRMLERTLVRAALPIRYSQGFNPQPRISLPLPRPVGVASDAELAWIELCAPMDPSEAAGALAQALPAGCVLLRLTGPHRGNAPSPLAAVYETPLGLAESAEVCRCVRRFVEAGRVEVRREYGPGKPTRTLDIRRLVDDLALRDGILSMRLRITEHGAARPAEVLAAAGLDANEHLCMTRRMRVEWNMRLPAD